jgi:hypothetical protein
MPEASKFDLESLIQQIYSAYAYVHDLHLSLPGTLAGMAVCALILLLTLRELGGWFSKVGSVKREISALRTQTTQIEAEIRVLQTLVAQLPAQLSAQMPMVSPSHASNDKSSQAASSAVNPAASSAGPIQNAASEAGSVASVTETPTVRPTFRITR